MLETLKIEFGNIITCSALIFATQTCYSHGNLPTGGRQLVCKKRICCFFPVKRIILNMNSSNSY